MWKKIVPRDKIGSEINVVDRDEWKRKERSW